MKKLLRSELGFSLLEMVVSILLIGVILISFFGIFIQSKKAGVTSEEIIDATYVAQLTMEELYKHIKNNSNLAELSTDSYLTDIYNINCNKQYTSCDFKNKDNTGIYLTAKDFEGKALVSVILEVKREKGAPVVMETVWRWK